MIYRLKEPYILRGWKGLPWVLVKRPRNKTHNLLREQFQVLLLCDGKTDVTADMLDETMQKALRQCEENGWVETCPKPQPLEPDQYYRYFKNRYVESVFWSITGKCNYRCRHCYMDAPDGALGELSTEQALDLIDQMAACGVLSVDITGGEPFVRKDFWKLIDRLVSHKIDVKFVYTNGWLFNESVLDEFESRRLKPEISISFDGVGWHDWMRSIPGAEKAALRALKLCQERGFTTDIQMCIHRGNVDVLPKTIELMKTVGVDFVKVGNVSMTNLWHQNSAGNALKIEEYIEAMIQYIPQYYMKDCPIELKIGNVAYLHCDGSFDLPVSGDLDDQKNSENRYLCEGARRNCYITPEGRLLPCLPMTASLPEDQKRFPLICQIGLQKGLDNSFYMQFVNQRVKDLLAVNKECAECKYKLKCGGGCRANALLGEDHSLMGCDREACLALKGGYVERIRQTAEKARAAYESRKAKAST